MPTAKLILGDCLGKMREIPENSIDAIVTDPPAGIGFMSKEFDDFRRKRNPADVDRDNVFGRTSARGLEYGRSERRNFIDWLTPRMVEALRVAKPGSYALIWAIPRTSHWTATAIEDAGWTIRDRISHLFGQGFPKAKSCLKPACEDWWLAWKPATKMTPLNIDACRIGIESTLRPNGPIGYHGGGSGGSAAGRWPANVVLSHAEGCVEVGSRKVKAGWAGGEGALPGGFADVGSASGDGRPAGRLYGGPDGSEIVAAWECVDGCPVAILNEQSGNSKSPASYMRSFDVKSKNAYGAGMGRCDAGEQSNGFGDSGGASRFFFTAKASRRDRGEGNTHPTVKSTVLMRWLCRLITPPGGTILDPFMGSGSTGVAALAEAFHFVGIESDPEYFPIAESRIATALAAVNPTIVRDLYGDDEQFDF